MNRIRIVPYLIMLLLLPVWGWSQETNDTTIYTIVEQQPLIPDCSALDTTFAVKLACSQQALLEFVSRRILYPDEARQQNIQGTVVINFTIEKDGSITRPEIVRDLGANTGLSALSVILSMQEGDFRFVPATLEGKPVRYSYNLPVRFRIREPLPYTLIGSDTIYTAFDSVLQFDGGTEALTAFIDQTLNYPPSGDSLCLQGQIDVKIQVTPEGRARVLDMTDFNDLGFDFWYEAIHAAVATSGKWQPATYAGRPVPAAIDISMSFTSEDPGCAATNADYQRAITVAQEGQKLFDEGEQNAGIAKMSEALALFPNDGQLLILRGQAFLDSNQLSNACEDLRRAREITLVNWYDNILPYVCAVAANADGE